MRNEMARTRREEKITSGTAKVAVAPGKAQEENAALEAALQRLLDKYVELLEWDTNGYVMAADRLPEVIEARALLQKGGR